MSLDFSTYLTKRKTRLWAHTTPEELSRNTVASLESSGSAYKFPLLFIAKYNPDSKPCIFTSPTPTGINCNTALGSNASRIPTKYQGS